MSKAPPKKKLGKQKTNRAVASRPGRVASLLKSLAGKLHGLVPVLTRAFRQAEKIVWQKIFRKKIKPLALLLWARTLHLWHNPPPAILRNVKRARDIIKKKAKPLEKRIKATKTWKKFIRLPFPARFAISVAGVAFLWILSGAIPSPFGGGGRAELEKETSVRIFASQIQLQDINLRLSGETVASRNVEVKAEINGRVLNLWYEQGNLVEAGDVIVELDKTSLPEELAEAEAEVELRRLQFGAARNLANRGLQARTIFIEAEVNLRRAQARLARTKRDLENTLIRAPFAGVVGDIYVARGDFLNLGARVVDVSDLDPLVVSASVSEKNINDIKVGNPARGYFINESQFEGIVTVVSRTGNRRTRTFDVEVEIANREAEIEQGLSAELIVNTGREKVHVLPSSILVLDDDGVLGVKAVEQGRVLFYPVKVLQSRDDLLLVRGLPEKLQIISVGQALVSQGQLVQTSFDTRFDELLRFDEESPFNQIVDLSNMFENMREAAEETKREEAIENQAPDNQTIDNEPADNEPADNEAGPAEEGEGLNQLDGVQEPETDNQGEGQ